MTLPRFIVSAAPTCTLWRRDLNARCWRLLGFPSITLSDVELLERKP